MNRPRFLTFVSRTQEADDWRRRCPHVEHLWAGQGGPASLPGFSLHSPTLTEFLVALQREHRSRPFSGVLNEREKYASAAGQAALCLGLPPIVRKPAAIRDKWLMRRALASAFPWPRSFLIQSEADLEQLRGEQFPLVLKPRFGFNSRSVVLVSSLRQLVAEYRRQRKCFARLRRPDESSLDFLVETFLSGSEHSLELLVSQGRVQLAILSDKAAMEPPYFVEVGDCLPSRLAESDQAKIIEAGQRAVTAVGIENGWSHIEVKLDVERGNQINIVEVAARMGGGYYGEMIEMGYGLDRKRLLADAQMGRPIPPLSPPRTRVVGYRIVSRGVEAVWIPSAVYQTLEAAQARCVWPPRGQSSFRCMVGPPHGYKNTVLEYLLVGEKARIDSRLRLLRLPIPGALYFGLRRLFGGNGPFDG